MGDVEEKEKPKKASLDDVLKVLDQIAPELTQTWMTLKTELQAIKDNLNFLTGQFESLYTMLGAAIRLQPPQVEQPAKLKTDLSDIPYKNDLDISANMEGNTIVKPKRYLAGSWNEVNDYLKARGFKWVSAGKESYWEKA